MHDRLVKLADDIGEAPLAPGAWPAILRELAAVVGGWGGELIAGEGARFRLYLAGDVPQELVDEYSERGGGNPRMNPRAAAVYTGPMMAVVCDPDYLPDDDRKRHPLYREFFEKADAPYAGLAVLGIEEGARLLVSVNYTAKQGLPDFEQRKRFAALLPSLAAAARLQIKLERHGADIALGVLERLGAPAFLCDSLGRVVGLSAPAEAMARSGDILTVRDTILRGVSNESDRDLMAAIRMAGSWRQSLAPSNTLVVLRNQRGNPWAGADVIALPRETGAFGLGGRVIVVVGSRFLARPNALLQLGLTQAEADVARSMCAGFSPSEIAIQRSVGISTIRSQLKSLYAKLGVSRQASLVRLLRDLL